MSIVSDVQKVTVDNICKIIDKEIDYAKDFNPIMAMGMSKIKKLIQEEYND